MSIRGARSSLARTWTSLRNYSTPTTESIPNSSSSSSSSPVPETIPASTSTSRLSTPANNSSRSAKSNSAVGAPTPVFAPHIPLDPTHGHHVATLHLRSHTTSLAELTFFTQFALRSARALGLPTSNMISLPTKTSLFTTPRSPFAHKKSQQNFWRKEHKRAIKVYDGNEEIVTAWLAFLRKEAMGGIGMKAQIFTYRALGWGSKMAELEGVKSELKSAKSEADEVKDLAQQLEKELEMDVKQAELDQLEREQEADLQAKEAAQPENIKQVEDQVHELEAKTEKLNQEAKEAAKAEREAEKLAETQENETESSEKTETNENPSDEKK